MDKILMEVCCGSADDVIEAWKGGADRVELNSNLFQGGLTPTIGTLLVAKRETDIPVMAMVRPREGGFCYPIFIMHTFPQKNEKKFRFFSQCHHCNFSRNLL